MLRPTFVFLILKVALTRAAEVIVFHGETAFLPSRADPAWTLETIEWSTFGNDTHIATYRKRVMNLNRTKQFRGRLSLNISTGDLTIYNVTEQDAMEYSVRLKNTLKENSINSNQLTIRRLAEKERNKETYPTVETQNPKTPGEKPHQTQVNHIRVQQTIMKAGQ
ncbi:uncharacterized protein si:cabz01074946.1 [Solea solea]|uniref:uncharacterized protein si:cabz01074946.1 n=1 Tax=Solea solea TaxID=90069 RepID=UPI00272D1E5C|nr:uncharacterized protein si:cabz01074946.1 [Solea solea]